MNKQTESTSKSKKTTGTTIALCGCTHVYQDHVYGPHKRGHNCGGKKATTPTICCTVCGNKKDA